MNKTFKNTLRHNCDELPLLPLTVTFCNQADFCDNGGWECHNNNRPVYECCYPLIALALLPVEAVLCPLTCTVYSVRRCLKKDTIITEQPVPQKE